MLPFVKPFAAIALAFAIGAAPAYASAAVDAEGPPPCCATQSGEKVTCRCTHEVQAADAWDAAERAAWLQTVWSAP